MDWHVLVVFGAIFSASITQCFSFAFEARTREKRNPQDQGLLFQARGVLNLGGLNIPQVASNVRKHLHDLVDTVTNPLNIQIVSQVDQVDPVNVNYEHDQQYDYVDQQYQNSPSSFEHPSRGSPRGTPPHDFRPRGPPGGGPPHGPPPYEHHPRDHHHGPPPRDHHHGPPPRDHHYGPPPRDHHHGPPPRDQHHGPPPRDHHHGPPPRDHHHGPPPRGPPPRGHHHGPPPRGPPVPPIYYDDPSSVNDNDNEDNQNVPDIKPDFSQQPNYPGRGNVNIELSSSSPPTTSSLNLDEVNTKKSSNVSRYIDDFPVILLTENEIR